MSIDTIVIGAGRKVVVLEKSRGAGGRSATRRHAGARFDHGAQYFTARTAPFGRQLQKWRDTDLVQPWRPRLAVIGDKSAHRDPEEVSRFVAVPGMNAVCRQFAAELDCRFEQRVSALNFDREWCLELESGERLQARRLLITAPPAQTAALLGAADPLHDPLAGIAFNPCIAGMLSFNKHFDPGFDAAFINHSGALSWVARNSSKPGREGNDWVLHATADWSQTQLEAPAEQQAGQLADAFGELVGEP